MKHIYVFFISLSLVLAQALSAAENLNYGGIWGEIEQALDKLSSELKKVEGFDADSTVEETNGFLHTLAELVSNGSLDGEDVLKRKMRDLIDLFWKRHNINNSYASETLATKAISALARSLNPEMFPVQTQNLEFESFDTSVIHTNSHPVGSIVLNPNIAVQQPHLFGVFDSYSTNNPFVQPVLSQNPFQTQVPYQAPQQFGYGSQFQQTLYPQVQPQYPQYQQPAYYYPQQQPQQHFQNYAYGYSVPMQQVPVQQFYQVPSQVISSPQILTTTTTTTHFTNEVSDDDSSSSESEECESVIKERLEEEKIRKQEEVEIQKANAEIVGSHLVDIINGTTQNDLKNSLLKKDQSSDFSVSGLGDFSSTNSYDGSISSGGTAELISARYNALRQTYVIKIKYSTRGWLGTYETEMTLTVRTLFWG